MIPHGCELMIASHNQVRSPLQAERMTSLRFLAGPSPLRIGVFCIAPFLAGYWRMSAGRHVRRCPADTALAVCCGRASEPRGCTASAAHARGRRRWSAQWRCWRRPTWTRASTASTLASCWAWPTRCPTCWAATATGCAARPAHLSRLLSGCGALGQAVCSRCWTCLCVCTRALLAGN